MTDIVSLISPLFGLIVLGGITALLTRRPVEELGWLTTFVIYLALPALFFNLISKTPVEELTSWTFIGTNIGVTFAILVATLGLGLLTSRRLDEATVQGLAGAYGNIGYMGPALALLAFGEAAAVPVAIIFCFENVMHFVLAPALMAVSGRGEAGALRLAARVVRQIVTHPFIIATALGVLAAIFEIRPPEPAVRLLDYLALAAAPCALFAMGVTLASRPLRRVPLALGYVVPMKLVAHPLAMYLALEAMGPFDPVWVQTAVLLAALPTATNVFVIAQHYGVWVERASAAVLVSTALSVLSVSYLLFVFTAGAP